MIKDAFLGTYRVSRAGSLAPSTKFRADLSASFFVPHPSARHHQCSPHVNPTLLNVLQHKMLKKPSLLLSSYGNIQNLYYPHYTTAHSLNSQHSLDQAGITACRTGQRHTQKRRYASLRYKSEDCSTSGDDLEWPESSSATKIPTPYQIFKQKKGAPYNKRRFYELVKIYHPDKHIHDELVFNPNCLSQAVKTERYRLVVAANDILSDPAKRKAYDIRGEGWGEDAGAIRQHWREARGGRWSGFDDNDSPARCATWEDWEKWYQRDAPKTQRTQFFSNGGFIAVVFLCAVLGGMGELSRARNVHGTFLEQLELRHEKSSKDLKRAREETQQFGSRDTRVQSFLRTRDPVGYGATDSQDEGYRKLLPASDLCISGDVQAHGSNGT